MNKIRIYSLLKFDRGFIEGIMGIEGKLYSKIQKHRDKIKFIRDSLIKEIVHSTDSHQKKFLMIKFPQFLQNSIRAYLSLIERKISMLCYDEPKFTIFDWT